jgi:hypothetical protein
MIKIMKNLLLLLFLVCMFSPAQAADWFVNNQSNSSTQSGNSANPFKEIQTAYDRAVPGDTIYVAATTTGYSGICVEKNNLKFIGTGNRPKIDQLVKCDGRNVLFFSRADDILVKNFTLDTSSFAGQSARALIFSGIPQNPIYRNHADNIHALGPGQGSSGRSLISSSLCYNCVLENSSSTGAEEHGIYWTNHQDGSIIRNNIVTDTDGACLQLNSDPETYSSTNPYQDGIMSNNLVEGNIFYNCGNTSGGAAVNLAGVEDSIFRNNLIYGAPLTGGIANWDDSFGNSFGCKRNVYYNNLIDCRHCDRHALSFRNGSIGNSFMNNIIITGSKDAIAVDSESNQNLTIDYNLYFTGVFFEDTSERWISMNRWQQEMGYDLHSHIAPSLKDVFVDSPNVDYHLFAGSLAIDKGANIQVTMDFDGNSRPQGIGHDIGPYEFVHSSPPHTFQPVAPTNLLLMRRR